MSESPHPRNDYERPVSRRAFVTITGAGLVAAPLLGLASVPRAGAAQSGGAPAAAGPPPAPRAVGRPMQVEADLGDPPTRRVGVAVVGLGNYALGQILPRIARTKHLRLAAVVSGNRDKARAVAAAYGLPERSVYGYNTYDQLRDDAGVDAVYVILPPTLHAEYTVRAARAGKHVLCEKPMAGTSAECRQMVDACRQANRRLMIGYRVHFEPHNVEARRLIAAGELGTLRQIAAEHATAVDPTTPHGEWRIQRALAGGGSLWDIGIYSLNTARFLSGQEPVEVRAIVRRPAPQTVKGKRADVELAIDWDARTASGLVITATSGYDHEANRLQVHGDRASIELDPATSYQGDRLRVHTRGEQGGMREPQLESSEQQFLGMLDEFALAVRENREPRTAGGAEGLRDVQVMELIYEAARTGRPVAVPARAAAPG